VSALLRCRLLTVVGLGVVCFAISPADARPAKRNTETISERSVLALQVALDRVRFSPGPMDGKLGANTKKAIKAFQRTHGLKETGQPDGAVWAQLGAGSIGPALVDYVITEKDVSGPFEASIPESLEDKAKLERLAYTGPDELLAEKFHMDIGLLKRLNKGKQFDQAGVSLQVANIGRSQAGQAARLEVDKKIGGVFVFDRQDAIIAFYPATIGSAETPSPSGKLIVTRVARNPTYTYDPAKLNFKGVTATEKLEIQPGPNNPVGLVWIGLSEPGYGIHGSPLPSAISRQNSHGCVRLTNWDALDLADMVKKGVSVDFGDSGDPLAKVQIEHDAAQGEADHGRQKR
jgi:lipoprotein-anchoring transpeptidase ErfK/SrfK